MVKDILGFAGQRDLINQLATDQIVQDRINAQRLQQVPAELRADDRRSTQGALGRRVKAVDAGGTGAAFSPFDAADAGVMVDGPLAHWRPTPSG